MAKANFERALAAILREEGGYADHPADPGGATMMGITHATLADWRGAAVTKADVRNLSRAEASAIYRARYWDAVRGDQLPEGLDLALFDLAVNSGPTRAIRLLQRSLGLKEDGRIGPATFRAIAGGVIRHQVAALMAERRRFLEGLSTWPVFGRGWGKRLKRIEAEALRQVAGAAAAAAKDLPRLQPHFQPRQETIMDDVKPMLMSKTVWANGIGLLALVLSLFGFNTTLMDPNALAEAVLQAVAAVSFVLSTAFRVIATKRIL
jgi:lysozyme family protein